MDKINPGSVDISIEFALSTAGLTIADMKLGYIRKSIGDGTSYTENISGALTALASITTAHMDNRAIYLDADATAGNQFIIRVDFPDAAFATGKDRVICNVYDDGENVIAHRIFDLETDYTKYPNGYVYYNSASSYSGTVVGRNGTPLYKENDEANAMTIAAAVGTKSIEVENVFTIPSQLEQYIIQGREPRTAEVQLNNQTIKENTFKNLRISGVMSSPKYNEYYDCILEDGVELYGMAHRCLIEDSILLADGECIDCYGDEIELDFTDASPSFATKFIGLACRILTVTNIDGGTKFSQIELVGNPDVIIGGSCNAGGLTLTGYANSITDNSTGTFVLTDQTNLANLSEEHSGISTQIDNIGTASGGAVNFAPIEDNTGGAIDPSSAAFVGTNVVGDYEDVGPGTSDSMSIDDVANDIDIVYGFQIGGNRQGVNIIINADVDGGPDQISVKVYDHVGAGWDTVGEIDDNDILNIPIVAKHTGTGAELGKVYIRFETDGTTPSNLEVFECLVAAVSVSQSVGYAIGRIWVDTNNGTAGTEPYVNGTADNPVLTWADALTLSASAGLNDFHILIGSSIQLSANSDSISVFGDNWNLDLNGQSIEGSHFSGANVTGIGVATVIKPDFHDCKFGAVTLPPCDTKSCGYGVGSGTCTGGSAGQYAFIDSYSLVPGSGSPAFVFSGLGSATGINVRGHRGGATWTLDSDCTLSHEVLAGGGQTFTSGGADIELRGIFRAATYVLSGAGTIQQVGVTGPITISGTSTATVNLYGVSSSLADTSVNTTVNDNTTSTENIDIELTASHDAGSWASGSGGDWTTAEKQQIRHRLNLDGTQAAPTAGGAAKMAGTDADLTLKSLVVNNAGGHAIRLIAGAGHGLFSEGGGISGDGIRAEGNGASSNGIGAFAGTSGYGVQAGSSAGAGMYVQGGNHAVEIIATGGVGVAIVGNGAFPAIRALGGATGDGIVAQSGGGNGNGLTCTKAGSGKDIDADELDRIEADTQDLQTQIGTAGDGLTDLGGMSTAMKAEVESEANDALVAQKLDHLVAVADADDAVDDSIVAKLASKSVTADWSTFDNTTDSLEALGDSIGTVPLTAQEVRDSMKLAPTGGAPAGGSVDEHLDGIQTQTDKMAFTVANELDSNIKSIDDDGPAATILKEAIPATQYGTVGSGTHTTIKVASSDLTGLTNDALEYKVINFKTGNNAGRSAPITSYDGTSGEIDIDSSFALVAVPVNGDTFTVT